MTHRIARAWLCAGGCWLPFAAHAIGTPAGTEIRNQAEISFVLNDSTEIRRSNSTTLRVLELLDVNLLAQTPERVVGAGEPAAPILFTLTNTGNGTERFALSVDSALGGNDFDPATPPVALYLDSDASGSLTGSDAAYLPGTNDPELAADASIGVLLLQDIPPGIADGEHGAAQLRAAALTANGSPGELHAAVGDGGVDALVGASGARAASIGRYLVGAISVTVLKSAAISDASGGSVPSSGATVVYTIRVSAVGQGIAAGAIFHDATPAHTTYVAGSLALNGAALSDTADTDGGEYIAATSELVVALGDLAPMAGSQEVKFAVTID
jgi:uncharacterized repeat protein (TIGR01451 family)